jgi:hypothetical protein
MNNTSLANDRIGQENLNEYGFIMKVVEYNKATDIWVKFLESGVFKHTTWKTFIKGHVKSPYDKSVYGIGYLGEGKYTPFKNGKRTRKYRIWQALFERCYTIRELKRFPTYIGCTVCEEWNNFQNFAAWYDQNYYEIEGEQMCLDKDILFKGNKIYSPETCVFVPSDINILFTKTNAKRGDFPIGVTYNKKVGKYQSRCNVNSKLIHIDFFNTPEEAFFAYKIFKEKLIKHIANKYKDKIPNNLYEAMLRYEVEITD